MSFLPVCYCIAWNQHSEFLSKSGIVWNGTIKRIGYVLSRIILSTPKMSMPSSGETEYIS